MLLPPSPQVRRPQAGGYCTKVPHGRAADPETLEGRSRTQAAPRRHSLLDARSGPWGDLASGRATSEVDPGAGRVEAKGGDSGDKRTGSWRSTAGPERLAGSTQPSPPLKCAPRTAGRGPASTDVSREQRRGVASVVVLRASPVATELDGPPIPGPQAAGAGDSIRRPRGVPACLPGARGAGGHTRVHAPAVCWQK